MAGVSWTLSMAKLRRSVLKDPGGVRWDDAALLDYANNALADLARVLPMSKTKTYTTTGIANTFELPTDMLRLDRVVWPTGAAVDDYEDLDEQPAYPTPVTAYTGPLFYVLDKPAEGNIWFSCMPSGTLTLEYGAYRPALTSGASELPIGRYVWMEQALHYHVAMQANLREGVTRASLEQWSTKPENPVGNPLNEEAAEMLKQYRRVINENVPRSK